MINDTTNDYEYWEKANKNKIKETMNILSKSELLTHLYNIERNLIRVWNDIENNELTLKVEITTDCELTARVDNIEILHIVWNDKRFFETQDKRKNCVTIALKAFFENLEITLNYYCESLNSIIEDCENE